MNQVRRNIDPRDYLIQVIDRKLKKKKINSKPLIIYLKKNFFIIHNLRSIKELQYKQQAHGHIIYILPHTMEHYWGLCASAVLC